MDLSTFTWLPAGTASDIPRPRAGGGTTVLNSAVVVVGGEGHGSAWPTVTSLNVATGRWATLPSLAAGRHGVGAVACGGALYTAAGAGIQSCCAFRRSTEALFVPATPGALPRACGGGGAPVAPTPTATAVPSPPAGGEARPTVTPAPGAVVPPTATPAPPGSVDVTPTATATATVTAPAAPTAAVGATPTPTATSPLPSPSAAANATDAPACFPADAAVAVPGGGSVPVANLRVGDAITVVSAATGRVRTSTVLLFSHAVGGAADDRKTYPFVELTIGGGGGSAPSAPRRLRLSAGHLLPVGAAKRLTPARAVAVGDTVWVVAPGAAACNATAVAAAAAAAAAVPAAVTAVGQTAARGLYNPHPASADDRLLVDGVVVADTTDALPAAVAAAGLAAARAVAAVAGGVDVTGGGLAGEGGAGGAARRLLAALASA